MPIVIGLLCWPVNPAQSAAEAVPPPTASPVASLLELSIEELMDVQVSTAARKRQPLSETAASVQVLGPEEIRRSGADTLPELLRLVPGVQVARQNANMWAISIRGLNAQAGQKVLVMVDGRSIYNPSKGGVQWDMHGLPVAEIQRIEVVRGPGGTLWGADAVNGVINIITKEAGDTRGTRLITGAGTINRTVSVIHGDALSEDAHYRFSGKFFDRSGFAIDGRETHDDWSGGRGAARLDWQMGPDEKVILSGELFQGTSDILLHESQGSPPARQHSQTPTDIDGGHLLMRWQRDFADGHQVILQGYFDAFEREMILNGETERSRIFDIDLQVQHPPFLGHEFIWGLGYRYSKQHYLGNFNFGFDPATDIERVESFFIQDEIPWFDRRLKLILGTKVQHHDQTGVEYQPNARLIWNPQAPWSAWVAVSKALRSPFRVHSAVRLTNLVSNGPPARYIRLLGNTELDSEELLAHEVGFRRQFSDRLSLDLSLFYNRYKNLRTVEPGTPFLETTPAPPHLVLPVQHQDWMAGRSHGLEASLLWRVRDDWKLRLGYAYLDIDLIPSPESNNPSSQRAAYRSPRHQLQLHSLWDLTDNQDLDAHLYHTDGLSHPDVPAYWKLDLRYAWRPDPNLELSLIGRDLLDADHPEFLYTRRIGEPSETPRSIFLQLDWLL